VRNYHAASGFASHAGRMPAFQPGPRNKKGCPFEQPFQSLSAMNYFSAMPDTKFVVPVIPPSNK
jgi:hypothetical protein